MVKNRVLICMASKEELNENLPNHKASMFKFGFKIQKYIDQAIKEYLPTKVENIDNKLDILSDKIETKADNERVCKLELEVNQLKGNVNLLEENINKLTEFLLDAYPPDTPLRRNIIAENFNNKEKCKKLLNEESEKSFLN